MAQPGAPVSNNMTASIISIFFFWPLAIPAIINASKVNERLAAGDIAGAQTASDESRKWSKLAFIVGGILWVLCCGGYLLFFVILSAASMA
jgi:ABC-type Fe3+ transport system permease subunit